jgi:hypothetical protein
MKIGNFEITLPGFDGGTFSREITVRSARRGAAKRVWPFLNQIGAANFRLAIQQNKPFLSQLDPSKFPDEWKDAISQAPQYTPIFAMLSDDDILSLLPPWLIALVNADEAGKKWWSGELSFIKSLFGRG